MDMSENATIVVDFLKRNASCAFARKEILEETGLSVSAWALAQAEVAACEDVTKTGNKRSTRYQFTGS